jgi:hypothetical protein
MALHLLKFYKVYFMFYERKCHKIKRKYNLRKCPLGVCLRFLKSSNIDIFFKIIFGNISFRLSGERGHSAQGTKELCP